MKPSAGKSTWKGQLQGALLVRSAAPRGCQRRLAGRPRSAADRQETMRVSGKEGLTSRTDGDPRKALMLRHGGESGIRAQTLFQVPENKETRPYPEYFHILTRSLLRLSNLANLSRARLKQTPNRHQEWPRV